MQEALTPELEIRCEGPGCEVMVIQPWKVRRKRYCSPACGKKAYKARANEHCASLDDKECRDCQQVKLIAEFKPAGNLRCRDCMKQVRQDEYKRRGGKEYIYEHNLKRYGLTLAGYQEKFAAQGGRCAICGDKPEEGQRLHVDHSHSTGAVRDLLCRWCNYALGNAKDDPTRLLAMAAYLERHTATEG